MIDRPTSLTPLNVLAIHAAEHAIGMLSSEQIPAIADDALTSGIYSDTLLELAHTPTPIMADVGPLFERAMRELGIWPPSQTEAAWRICRYLVEGVLKSPQSPQAAVYRIAYLAWHAHRVFGNTHTISALDVGELYGIEDEYSELTPEDVAMSETMRASEQQARTALNDRALIAAEKWLARHPTEGRL